MRQSLDLGTHIEEERGDVRNMEHLSRLQIGVSTINTTFNTKKESELFGEMDDSRSGTRIA